MGILGTLGGIIEVTWGSVGILEGPWAPLSKVWGGPWGTLGTIIEGQWGIRGDPRGDLGMLEGLRTLLSKVRGCSWGSLKDSGRHYRSYVWVRGDP